MGPRGDGYVAAGHRADEAAAYHRAQVASLAGAGVDVVHAMTLNEVAEAVGVVRAARDAGVPVGVSFTVETDGRLPDGTPLRDAVAQVDAQEAADWYGVNCAHPLHVLPALDGGAWQERLQCFRPNASTLTHAELDVMEELDEGDRDLLAPSTADLLAAGAQHHDARRLLRDRRLARRGAVGRGRGAGAAAGPDRLASGRHEPCVWKRTGSGHTAAVIFAFFSARLRRWLLLAVALPLAGRLLEGLGADRGSLAACGLRAAPPPAVPAPAHRPAAARRGWSGRRRR